MRKKILIFHPDIHLHKTNNEYTKKIYGILKKKYDVKSFEWFLRHPFSKNVAFMYLNWFENTVGRHNILLQKVQYRLKYYFLCFSHFRKVKIAYVVHNKTPHSVIEASPIYQRAAKPFMEKALNKADIIIELCSHTESYLKNEFNLSNADDKIILVPHGKYTKYECKIDKYLEKYNIGQNEMVFCFVGKMDKYKNIDIIIKAFYQANIKGKLLLVGKCDDMYKKTLHDLIIDSRVVCDFSFVSDEDMSGLFQMAHAVVLPYENTSINSGILINAFSNGTTVIGTKIEMLQDYSEELVYGYSYETVEEHILELSKAMKRAELDFENNRLKEKGSNLEILMQKNNDWKNIETELLKAVQ